MSTYDYKTILEKAKTCKKSVESNQKLGVNQKWGYYFAMAILNPKKTITKVKFTEAPKPSGDHISNQISKADYLTLCKRLVKVVNTEHRMANAMTWKNKHFRCRDYVYNFAKILVWYDGHNTLPAVNNINTKIWVKPTEYPEEIYNYFIKQCGKFNNTIDGALNLIAGNGYAGYSDDYYSNKTSIDRMANGNGINCTDSCHVFFNIMKHLIKLGKYRKVECLHVRCSSGTGHVRLRITLNSGETILRDPAAVLDTGDVTYNWCTSNFELWAINPSWFMENLER